MVLSRAGSAGGGLSTLLLLGCASGDLSVQPTQLTGRWSIDVMVAHDSAPNHTVYLDFVCQGFAFPGPVAVDSEGHFAADGTVYWATWRELQGQPIALTGTEYRDSLALVFEQPIGYGAYVQSLVTLKRGQHWAPPPSACQV